LARSSTWKEFSGTKKKKGREKKQKPGELINLIDVKVKNNGAEKGKNFANKINS